MFWKTKGNDDNKPDDFLGTVDKHPLVVKTNDVEAMRVTTDGQVGIGTSTPQNRVHVGAGSTTIDPARVNVVVANNGVDAGVAIAQNSGVNVLLQASGAGGYIGTTSNHPLVLRTLDFDRVIVRQDGKVHIGPGVTSIAASRINVEVASTAPDAGIAIAQNTGVNVLLQASSAGGFIGTTTNHPLVLRTNDQDRVVIDTAGNMRVNGDVILANADCAEDFDVSDAALGDPGTVMVLSDDGKLEDSSRAYDRRVAGVVSGAGTYKPAIVLDKQHGGGHRKAIALMGKVFCKVDAQEAAIEIGDLLTTSSTPGHAMKASDPARAFGAVIGKALRPLADGVGMIPVLIALQ
jgi:hypothetical protein